MIVNDNQGMGMGDNNDRQSNPPYGHMPSFTGFGGNFQSIQNRTLKYVLVPFNRGGSLLSRSLTVFIDPILLAATGCH